MSKPASHAADFFSDFRIWTHATEESLQSGQLPDAGSSRMWKVILIGVLVLLGGALALGHILSLRSHAALEAAWVAAGEQGALPELASIDAASEEELAPWRELAAAWKALDAPEQEALRLSLADEEERTEAGVNSSLDLGRIEAALAAIARAKPVPLHDVAHPINAGEMVLGKGAWEVAQVPVRMAALHLTLGQREAAKVALEAARSTHDALLRTPLGFAQIFAVYLRQQAARIVRTMMSEGAATRDGDPQALLARCLWEGTEAALPSWYANELLFLRSTLAQEEDLDEAFRWVPLGFLATRGLVTHVERMTRAHAIAAERGPERFAKLRALDAEVSQDSAFMERLLSPAFDTLPRAYRMMLLELAGTHAVAAMLQARHESGAWPSAIPASAKVEVSEELAAVLDELQLLSVDADRFVIEGPEEDRSERLSIAFP